MAITRFYPQLEGMRALASIGVLTTHVAFQTRAVELPVVGPLLGRLDLAVALFFALSGFLLWRPWVAAAQGAPDDPEAPTTPSARRYLLHRFIRIWPAYVVVVAVVLTLLPEANRAGATVWLSNLTLTQVFVPLSLTAGLTQMWSLSVEVAFYLLLPILGYAAMSLRRRPGTDRSRWRIPALAALGVLSVGWGWVAVTLPVAAGVEPKNWVFGHLPWFLVGLILAETVGALDRAVQDGSVAPRWVDAISALGGHRWLMLALLVVAYVLACTPIAGPTGLGDLSAAQFAIKMILGALCAFAVLAPLVCGPADRSFRFLSSAPMLALGRWSYGIFIWHLVVLAVVFGLFGILPFNGHAPTVWTLTLVLTVGVSAASYAFVEEPARRWLRNREKRIAARTRAGSTTVQTAVETATAASN